MGKNTPDNNSDNLFYFYDAFCTHCEFFAIFINNNKNKFLPVILDGLKFATVVSVINNKLGLEHCGTYSYIIYLVNKRNLSIDCVNFMFSEKIKIPLTNLVIRNKRTKKIDDISKLFIFPADGAMISFLLKVPISVDDNSMKYLTLPIMPNVDLPLLFDFIKTSIMFAEEKEDKNKQG